MTTPKLFDRAAKEAREAAHLAPFAMLSCESQGRVHPQKTDPLRTVWERDRDRITHSMAFRRLRHKAQVFVSWEGDHNRTRLSHSLEVCQVARSVGSALFVNEALCEALALCHDIGHPPFGHRGEWALDALMKEHGGFRHNAQVLRVVDLLERRTPLHPGLNLTREVRESLLKHEKSEDWPAEFGAPPKQPCVEAQIVDHADSTAYNAHDVDDGLRTGIFDEAFLAESSALWRHAKESVERSCPGFLAGTTDLALRNRRIVNDMLRISIEDLIAFTAIQLQGSGLTSAADVKASDMYLVGHTKEMRAEVGELERFLHKNFYKHPHLVATERRASETLEELFAALLAKPDEMPSWYQSWRSEVGDERATCDYIAGMTDSFADAERTRLC
ncbi:MAG: dNTP triphosphohydrolase [Planctomycetota bacterium]|nr:dNTP triphosphohydrolase [Planctomycetota bacterium]